MAKKKKAVVKKMTQKEFKQEKKKAKAELSGKKLVALNQAKSHFMNLILMYERMATLFKIAAKSATHPLIKKTPLPQGLANLVTQHHEMGEELKSVGNYLDMMGGEPSMRKPEEKKQEEIDKMREEEKVKDEEEKKESEEVKKEEFVSNIQPESDKPSEEKEGEEK